MKVIALLLLSILVLDSGNKRIHKIIVRNPLELSRVDETVTISCKKLEPLVSFDKAIRVTNAAGEELITQLVDLNTDGHPDELLFQVDLKAHETKTYFIENNTPKKINSQKTTYSRLVPERIDDYAWENDRVAFRTYGPTAQRIVEEGKPGGTLSSGMDCWLKRVDYPIINKWYKQHTEGKSYHKDHGEGYDPYHVNASRGCGGIGVWVNDSLYVSKNFDTYKTIANGPIRTIFELTYAQWSADGIIINEKKRISLDLGSQLSKYEVTLLTSAPLPNCTVGITLHDKKGETFIDQQNGWGSYWEPLDDSELGTGVVVAKNYLRSFQDYRTDKKDLSQLYAITSPKDNTVIYFAGYGWKKAGVFNTAEDWNKYLAAFSKKIASPLEVHIK
jgi:hypothetical protein